MAFQIAGIGWLWAGLKAIVTGAIAWVVVNLGAIVANALVALGLYFFVAEPAVSVIGDELQQRFQGLSGTVLETLYYLNVDDYLAAVTSAFATRKTYEAATSKKVQVGKKTAPQGGA